VNAGAHPATLQPTNNLEVGAPSGLTLAGWVLCEGHQEYSLLPSVVNLIGFPESGIRRKISHKTLAIPIRLLTLLYCVEALLPQGRCTTLLPWFGSVYQLAANC